MSAEGGSGASKNFSSSVFSSQLKISLTVNGNLAVKISAFDYNLLVTDVMGRVFIGHDDDVVNELLHAIVVETAEDVRRVKAVSYKLSSFSL